MTLNKRCVGVNQFYLISNNVLFYNTIRMSDYVIELQEKLEDELDERGKARGKIKNGKT
jgi:hypothetical protein